MNTMKAVYGTRRAVGWLAADRFPYVVVVLHIFCNHAVLICTVRW
jgi:hypothetical protein